MENHQKDQHRLKKVKLNLAKNQKLPRSVQIVLQRDQDQDLEANQNHKPEVPQDQRRAIQRKPMKKLRKKYMINRRITVSQKAHQNC